jgi:hypothetical protein
MALTADKKPQSKVTGPHSSSGPVADSAVLYRGALLALNATGYLVPASTTAGLRVVGMATRKTDNSDGGDGDLAAQWETGVFCFKNDATYPISQADVGRVCWVKDDETVQDERGGSSVVAGIVMAYESSSKIWVLVGPDTAYVPGALVPGGLEVVAAPGAISTSVYETHLSAIDGTDAFTMGDGLYLGQRKRVTCTGASNTPLGTVTLNGAQAAYGTERTTWTFTTAGQWVEWEWTATGWKIIGLGQLGAESLSNGDTANPLCLVHFVNLTGANDYIQGDGVIAGQRSIWNVTAGANGSTISGLFYDEDGQRRRHGHQRQRRRRPGGAAWVGSRWLAETLVSATVS